MTLPPRVLMMVTQPDNRLTEIVSAAVKGGVNVVQFRDKSLPDPREEVQSLRRRIGNRVLLVVNGHFVEEADGVHLPEDAKSIDKRGKLLGRSVHSVEHALCAESEGADYLVVGTIFPSLTHPNTAASGVGLIEQICARVSAPVIAIGGVTPSNARACIESGASGVAVLSHFMSASDPCAIATEYWRAIA